MLPLKRLRWFAASLVILEFSTYASNDMILPAMPKIVHDFGGELYHIPLSMSLYILGCACLQLFVAPLSDYYGVKKALLLGACYFFITTMSTIFSFSIETFLSFRFLAGASMAFASLGYSVIHRLYDDKGVTQLTSLMQNFTIISPVVGPLMGVFLIQYFSWHIIFIFSATLSIFSFVGIKYALPAQPFTKQRFDLGRMLKEYALLLKKRVFVIGVITCTVSVLPYLIWIAFSTTVIKSTLHLDDTQYVTLQFIALGGAFFSTILLHFLAGKVAFVKLMIAGFMIAITGLCLSIWGSSNIYTIAIGIAFYGFGEGTFNTLAIRVMGTIPFHKPPMVFTLLTFFQLVGFFLGITAMEFLFDKNHYQPITFAISNGAIIIMMLPLCSYFIYLNRARKWQ